jgi:hypothetical protein
MVTSFNSFTLTTSISPKIEKASTLKIPCYAHTTIKRFNLGFKVYIEGV